MSRPYHIILPTDVARHAREMAQARRILRRAYAHASRAVRRRCGLIRAPLRWQTWGLA